MKTTFSRMFALVAAVILLCLLVLGASFLGMLNGYLREENRESMHKNTVALVNLAAAYEASGELDNRWGGFRIAMTSVGQVASADVILCDLEGRVYMCSCQDGECVHSYGVIAPALLRRVLENRELFSEGTLSGIYDEPRYLNGMAVTSLISGKDVGVLFMATARQQVRDVILRASNIFAYVSVLVLLVAMVACYILSRSQVRSLQAVTRAATRFGHGDLEARVAVGGKNTVEVDELATAFNTMAESLAQVEVQRREFVANVSHELKTPMTTISGFMDGMLDGTIPQTQHRHYMQIVSDEVRRLSRLVRSMLEISRMQSRGVDESRMRRFDLAESIGQVLISFEQRINRKGLHVDVQLPERSAWTKAEPDSITQVIYNLTDNAIKFCNEGGLLSLRLETEGGKHRVTVQNTGPTVDPAELPLLFDRFHKTDKSRSEDREGGGRGLYIVKTVLDGHGEDITVTSEQGVTTFTFTLPAVR